MHGSAVSVSIIVKATYYLPSVPLCSLVLSMLINNPCNCSAFSSHFRLSDVMVLLFKEQSKTISLPCVWVRLSPLPALSASDLQSSSYTPWTECYNSRIERPCVCLCVWLAGGGGPFVPGPPCDGGTSALSLPKRKAQWPFRWWRWLVCVLTST